MKVTNLDYIKPEKLTAIEVGYKSAVKKFVVDVNGYFNIYEDFITQTSVVGIDSTTHQGKTLYGVNDVFAGRASSPTTWRPYVNTVEKFILGVLQLAWVIELRKDMYLVVTILTLILKQKILQ
ncbi:MAG: hypothetical protein IPI52_00715 [Bacteroidetes bacterium]|nr:hypothetical protein [Bacteroidota bacterium]